MTIKKVAACVYILKSLISFKVRNDLSICDADSESLCAEVINRNTKIIIINTIYNKDLFPSHLIKRLKDNYLAKVNIEPIRKYCKDSFARIVFTSFKVGTYFSPKDQLPLNIVVTVILVILGKQPVTLSHVSKNIHEQIKMSQVCMKMRLVSLVTRKNVPTKF